MPATELLVPPDLLQDFRQALGDCEGLFRTRAAECTQYYPQLLNEPASDFQSRMLELHRALLVKIFFDTVHADQQWSEGERQLSATLMQHVWGEPLTGRALQAVVEKSSTQAARIEWSTLIAPFAKLPPFQQAAGELQTVVMRIANLVAKVDGICPAETVAHIKSLQYQLWQHLSPRQPTEPLAQPTAGPTQLKSTSVPPAPAVAVETPAAKLDPRSEAERLAEALAELDQLVGLTGIKSEVRELINYLKVQRERARIGLPATAVTLHMVFLGNPGTGKTTVARILGRIFGALGILQRGHLIETDRSGLVAEYVGQTAPRTQAKVDEALDGLLFIDEAYSLYAASGDDPFGAEALQILLKRSEDDRTRLVVIMAGYSAPMQQMLRSNPGLLSRFSRQLTFPDYSIEELGQIMDRLCQQNHYQMTSSARQAMAISLQQAVAAKDEHFGNGRHVRNLFEDAIRTMANRVAAIPVLSHAILTTLEAEDFAGESA